MVLRNLVGWARSRVVARVDGHWRARLGTGVHAGKHGRARLSAIRVTWKQQSNLFRVLLLVICQCLSHHPFDCFPHLDRGVQKE